ncbi:MAG: cytosine permease [Alphaproteobacteria bacterium]
MKEFTLQQILNEDTPLAVVKQSSRQGLLWLAAVMVGVTICVPVFMMGSTLAGQLAFADFAMAALLGGTLAALMAIATGVVGQRTGLPTATLATITFGTRGAMLANAAMALGSIGWFGIQTSVFATAFVAMVQQVWGMVLPVVPVMIVAGAVMSTTAIVGFRGLGKLGYVATPLLLVVLGLPVVHFIQNGQLAGVWAHVPATPTLTMGAMASMVAGAYSFSTIMPDFTRFMRSVRGMVGAIVLNFVVAYPLLLVLTGAVSVASGQPDFMQLLIGLGFGVVAILALFLATWTTNDGNVYTAALAGNIFMPQLPRWQVAALVGVLGTACAVAGIFEHFMSWLMFSGNVFPPMAGVYVADYWLNRARYANLENRPAFRWRTVLAWAAGLGVGLATTAPEAMGFGVLTLTTIPALDALLAGAAVRVALR